MLSMSDAEKVLLKNRPAGSEIKGKTLHEGKYLFIAHWPDPLEGTLDPFFSVDAKTGEFSDFSPQDYNNPREIIDKLN